MRSMRTLPATLVLLAAGCAPLPPERAERDRILLNAIEPCKRQYPAVRVMGLDDHGRVYAQVSEHEAGDMAGFERCAREALKREFDLRPFGMGKLAATAGPAAVTVQTLGSVLLVSALVNGVSATLLLDTGATLTIIRPSLARRAGIELPPGAPKILGAAVGGQEVSVPFVRVWSVSVGAAAVEGLEVGVFEAMPQFPDVDGILGGNFLSHFKVTIDRQSRRLTLEPARPGAAVAREWRLPAWMPGDEWRLRWRSPTGGGTYVRRVQGEEAVEDVAHYVVRSGSRSTYYVKATLGWHFEKADGVITLRRTPALAHDWPLRVGKSWELNYRREDLGGQARELYRRCGAVDEPTLSVTGGVFLTLHVVCRDRAGRIAEEWWYANEVKSWVRQRMVSSQGERVDELVSYSLTPR